ncbi:hypothetical protein Scep_007853 [Stephania cephalantha]|uniref:Uncharacterized protein n=1 Tax=Stephania cephalantha TaxID=152367 RepID=A0AAP0PQF5_9MAGN
MSRESNPGYRAIHKVRVPSKGLGNNSGDYQKLKVVLEEEHGLPRVVVARVSRPDWLRNAAGLLDPNYWRGTLRPRPVLDWYLDRVHEAVALAYTMFI